MRLLVICCVLASAACAPRDAIVPSIGAAFAAGAATGAYAVGEANASEIAIQVGGGSVGALLPAVYLDSIVMEEDDPPSTLGGLYSSIGSGFGKALLYPVTLLVPSFTTWAIGEERQGASPEDNHPFLWAFLGAGAGSVIASFAATKRMPQWARVALRATLIGSFSALGHQIGR